jgi:hypothetical protein
VSVVVVCWEGRKLELSAVRSPIELKLGGDLGLLSQISVHALVSRLTHLFTFCKHFVNKQTNKNTEIAKSRF